MNSAPPTSFRDLTTSHGRGLKERTISHMKRKADEDSDTSTIPRTASNSAHESSLLSNGASKPPKRRPTRYIEGFIPVSEYVNLESLLKIPEPQQTLPANKVAILSHPWSWFGGCMDDPVLDGISRVFLRLDYHVVLFNSRGVGHSSGHSSLTGIPESEDLLKVIEWALQEVGSVETVVLVGYSYGSLITSMAPPPHKRFPGVRRSCHILLSHAVGPSAFLTLFNTGKYSTTLNELVAEPTSNVLTIWGDLDQFTSKKSYVAWSDKLKAVAGRSGAPKSAGEGKSIDRICQLFSAFRRRPQIAAAAKAGYSGPKANSANSNADRPLKEGKELSAERSSSTKSTDSGLPNIDQSSSSKVNLPPSSATQAQDIGAPKSDTIPPGMVRCGAFQSTVIPGADHFWRGEKGRQMRLVITKWITKFDAGEFDPAVTRSDRTAS